VASAEPRQVLSSLGVRARKGLGQHFLVDPRVAERHLNHAHITVKDVVLEIGPGLGVLTRGLATRAKRVVAIETDRTFANYLRETLPDVEIIQGDALELDWPAFDVMVSNLPYAISSPLTFKLLDEPFDRAVLMYQWEFARRMVASAGSPEYSRLSVGVYRRASCMILERVPRNAFHPQPKVDSALVRLEPRPAPFRMPDPELYDAIVGALFRHRRKTLENGLRLGWRSVADSPEAFEIMIPHLPFLGRRVEELRPEDIALLAEAILRAKG